MWRGRGLRFPAFDGARAEGVGRRPWALIIPFEIDSDNHVRLVTDVRFINAEGKERRERIPQTAAIAERMNLPPRVYEFPKESARPTMGERHAATTSGE